MFAVECAKDKRKMWHLRGFPWCIASVLNYVSSALCYVHCYMHCATCTVLCMHSATCIVSNAPCYIFGWSKRCFRHVLNKCITDLVLAWLLLSCPHTFSSAWWSSNEFQADVMYKFLAWCSKVSSLVTGSHIWRHLWWSSRWPDMLSILPFLNGAILNWNDSSFSQKRFTFTLPSNWVLSGEGVVPRVIDPRQRWWSCWGRRQVCKIQKQSQTGWSTITIT